MPALAAGGLMAAASLYGANKSAKAANAGAAQMTEATWRAANQPRWSRSPTGASGLWTDANGARMAQINPAIQNMRMKAVENIPQYQDQYNSALNQYQSGITDQLGQVTGNQNAFMQARVNPLLQQAALTRGNIVNSLTQRGLGGSSFYTQGLGNFEREIAGAAGDQRALATQESLGMQNQLLGQQFGAAQQGVANQRSLDQSYAEIANMNLNQELAALGLTPSDIGAISGAANNAAQMRLGGQMNSMDLLGRGLGSLGSINWGSLGGKTASFGQGQDWAKAIGL